MIVRVAGGPGIGSGMNGQSLMLEVRHGRLSVWMPGDVEKGSAAWGRVERKAGEKTILFLPHHGSPRAAPSSWVAAARPSVVVSQNRNCLAGENLLPSAEYFLLENGAFTVRSDGVAVYCSQEGGPRFWSLIWRLP